MTDDTATITALRAELESAFRNRADLYRLLLDELEAAIGAQPAEALLARALEQRGREVAGLAFAAFGPDDAVRIGETFLAGSPDGGRMYPVDVEHDAYSISFRVRRCPLKDAWMEAGVSQDRLVTLCRIAGAFDRGLFEATGIRFENVTWTPGHGAGCCHIHLADAAGQGR